MTSSQIIATIADSRVRRFVNDSAFFYRGGFCVNADGGRTCYAPANNSNLKPLDYLANAGNPNDGWWGIACNSDNAPYISDTGYYVSTTSLCDSRFPESSPERYVDSETVPFYVLPVGSYFGAKLGDCAYVYNTNNGCGAGAIFADAGPKNKIGEGSIFLASLLKIPSNPKNGGCEDGIIWVVFPGSKDEQIFPINLTKLQAKAEKLFRSWGGVSRLAGEYSSLKFESEPSPTLSASISDVSNLKPMILTSLEDLAKESEQSIGTLSIKNRTCFKDKPLQSTTPGLRIVWVDPGVADYDIIKRLPDVKGHYHLFLRLPSGKEIEVYIYGLDATMQIKDDDGSGGIKLPTTMADPKNSTYKIRFRLATANNDDLILGTLDFLRDGEIYNTLTATSSLPGRQQDGSWNRTGGLLPPTSMVKAKTGNGLSVKTTPVFMPEVKGVSGNFYQISPFEMKTDGNVRGDWGCHDDANMPGSMGCVVFPTKQGWIAFQREMKVLADLGIRSIELICEYT
jgi:Fungal chitosanase of glycosyl hydrolase group 75